MIYFLYALPAALLAFLIACPAVGLLPCFAVSVAVSILVPCVVGEFQKRGWMKGATVFNVFLTMSATALVVSLVTGASLTMALLIGLAVGGVIAFLHYISAD